MPHHRECNTAAPCVSVRYRETHPGARTVRADNPDTEVNEGMSTAEITMQDLEQLIEKAVGRVVDRRLAERNAIRFDEPRDFALDELTAGDKPVLKGAVGIVADWVHIESRLFDVEPQNTKVYSIPAVKKAIDTATSGSGLEWVPSTFSQEFVEAVMLEARVASLFDRVPMPTKQLTLPAEGADPTPYLVSENTDLTTSITESSPGTRSVTLTAKKLAVRTVTSTEWEQDAMPVLLERVRQKMIRAIARGIENAIINGDTSQTHQDSDVTSASDVRKAWTGLRYRALNTTGCSADLSTFNADNILQLKKALGEYGLDPNDLAWIVGPSVANQLLLLKDANNNLLVTTLDKMGTEATIVRGELGRLFGIPVVPSAYVREDLNASGVYDGTTTNKTCMLLVNRRAWVLGDRQQIAIENVRHPGPQAIEIVATWRGQFAHVQGTNDTDTAIGYNIAT